MKNKRIAKGIILILSVVMIVSYSRGKNKNTKMHNHVVASFEIEK